MQSFVRAALVVFLISICSVAFAQTNGAILPDLPPVFTGPGAGPAANAKLCWLAAGTTTTWATVYSDSALASPLPNPTTLSALGIPQTGGGASTQIYLSPTGAGGGGNYKAILYAAGTGNTCNGTTVGAVIWTRDNVYDAMSIYPNSFASKNIDNVRKCDAFPGVTAGAKIAACIADLPAGGGTADARGLDGAQAISSTVTIAKPVTVLIGATAFSASASTVTVNVTSPGVSIECLNPNASTFTETVDSDGFRLASTATGFTMRNCGLIGHNTHVSGITGIDGDGPVGVTLENVQLSKWGGHCINTGGSGTAAQWHLINVDAGNCFEDGVLFTGTDPGTTDSQIIGGRYHHNGANGIDINGSKNFVGGGVEVDHNGCPGGAVDVFGVLIAGVAGLANADNNTVAGANIHENCGPGVIVRAEVGKHANHNLITGTQSNLNSGTSGNGDGATIDGSAPGTLAGNKLTGNVFRLNQRKGIQVDGSVGAVTDTQVGLNDLTDNTGGASVDSAVRTDFFLNKINNTDNFARLESALGVSGSFIQVGTNPASAGAWRTPNATCMMSAGATHADYNLLCSDASNQTVVGATGQATALLGGVYVNAATGGNEGNGTINATGYYLNGTAGTTGTVTCPAGQAIASMTIAGGIVTALGCRIP